MLIHIYDVKFRFEQTSTIKPWFISSLTESFSGSPTIRAYQMQGYFIKVNETRIEEHQMCSYPEIVSNSWLFSRLEALAR